MGFWTDDITFCMKENCHFENCIRNRKNIKVPNIPHSYGRMEGTIDCPTISCLDIVDGKEKYTVNPFDMDSIIGGVRFKADHIKARADPEFFLLIANMLERLYTISD